jgi:heptosyltransferase-2
MLSRGSAPAPRPLAVRLCNWVGEVVLATPTLKRLAAAGYDLQLVGKGWAPALLEGTGWPVLVRPPSVRRAAGQLAQLRRAVVARGARPAAVLLTKSFSSALEARLGGWQAIGYARDGRSLLLDAAVPLERFEHASHAYWHLASRFLGVDEPYPTQVELSPSAAQQARATAILAERSLDGRPFVVVCPFSGADDVEGRKVWPGYGEFGRRLAAAGTAMVVCPGPGEEARATQLLPGAILLPGLDLGVYAAVLGRAAAVVSNDTGPGHLAAAAGARLLAVYGPQSVAAWAPLGARVELLHDSSGWSSVEQVIGALRR